MPPPLLILADEAAYQQHFVAKYCAVPLLTHDGIPVYFKRHAFYHAFFETVIFKNDTFSPVRSQRMDWVELTLKDVASDRFQGWNPRIRQYDPVRRVDVVYEDFVVVLRLIKRQDGNLAAQFVTCFQADNSIGRIRQSPKWDRKACENALFER